MNNLIITTEEGSRVTVTADEAPELHTEFTAFRAAPEGSSREQHLWNRVLEYAGCYLDDNGHDGEEVTNVYEDEATSPAVDVCIAGAPAQEGVCGDPQCVCAPSPAPVLNPSELATVLHALRKLQDPANCNYACEHFDGDDVEQLTDEQIDALCERLNASPARSSVTHDALGIKGLTVGTPEQFLDAAREAQRAFWDALAELESVLGVDVDGTRDLEDVTLEELQNDKDGE